MPETPTLAIAGRAYSGLRLKRILSQSQELGNQHEGRVHNPLLQSRGINLMAASGYVLFAVSLHKVVPLIASLRDMAM